VLSHTLADEVVLRPLQHDDGGRLSAAYLRNREHLLPWEPVRSEEFFTREWQEEHVTAALLDHAAGRLHPLVLARGEEIVGRLNVGDVVRGAFQSAGLGYWTDARLQGKGIMTAAVRAVVELARDELDLHRLQAATLVHNTASQAVLARAGFERIGLAPRYLQIAGRWQDHVLFQVLNPAMP
jgi:ribosomal-protein-alanine N-acetyltransferase